MNNLFDISGRVAVMTGACGVLGATIVKYFAAQSCKVVLLDLDRAAEKGQQLVAEIKADGGFNTFSI
ncbi:MAG: SDR family NAD(P)-dependent oxidoreductase [Bacteroidales bacterium]|nr:SDR family NAD(P)-dependent oxidoreductase [Bacteroidales bacterium]